jgi:hypothetical protein
MSVGDAMTASRDSPAHGSLHSTVIPKAATPKGGVKIAKDSEVGEGNIIRLNWLPFLFDS